MFYGKALKTAYKGCKLGSGEIADTLGISLPTWYAKLEGRSDWKLEEIQKLVCLLRVRGWKGNVEEVFPIEQDAGDFEVPTEWQHDN